MAQSKMIESCSSVIDAVLSNARVDPRRRILLDRVLRLFFFWQPLEANRLACLSGRWEDQLLPAPLSYYLVRLKRRRIVHAGVIVILSLVCQILADGAVLPDPLLWFVRIGVPLSAILISAGFFFSMLPPTATQASGAVALIYAGAVILALAVVTLGVGLLRS